MQKLNICPCMTHAVTTSHLCKAFSSQLQVQTSKILSRLCASHALEPNEANMVTLLVGPDSPGQPQRCEQCQRQSEAQATAHLAPSLPPSPPGTSRLEGRVPMAIKNMKLLLTILSCRQCLNLLRHLSTASQRLQCLSEREGVQCNKGKPPQVPGSGHQSFRGSALMTH